jgi:Flp pilus assembly protein TadD
MQGYATLPDGTTTWLILIKNWDFNWQGDYRYASPVFLPKGTKLSMRYTFDNSTNNIHNPNNPPKRVTYGPQTTDEMAELWFQLLPRNRADREVLAQALSTKMQKIFFDYDEYLLRTDPTNVKGHIQRAVALLGQGSSEEARQHLQVAATLDPQNDQPHYYLGLACRQQHNLADARAEFETALRLNPDNFKAHGNLGLIFAEQGILDQAESHFLSALRINPDDSLAQESLNELLKAKRRNK